MTRREINKRKTFDEEFEALVRKMQTPQARAGAASVGTATMKALAKAAARYRNKETKCI